MTSHDSPAASHAPPPAPTSPGLRHNAWLIARREYLDRVRTRAFFAATIILVAVAVGLALAPIGLRALDRGSIVKVGIVASDPKLEASTTLILDSILNHVTAGADPAKWERHYRFESVADESMATKAVEAGKLRAALVVKRAADGGLDFTFHTSESSASTLSQLIQYGSFGVGVLDYVGRSQAAGGGSGGQGVTFHLPGFDVASTNTAAEAGRPLSQQEAASRTVLATVLIVLIFINLTIYGMWVATSVAAEKSSRVMELLVSAATPHQLLLGKVIGVGGAGLTQYLAILVPAVIVVALQDRIASLLLGPAPAGGEAPLVGLSVSILLAYGVFFLLGFALYALLYAAAGSFVSRQEDVQTLAFPLSLIAMASYLAAAIGLSSIGSNLTVVLSFVPFSSPFVMLSRLMLGRVEPWELIVSVALLGVSILVALWLAARIYATGVLLYGQRPGLRQFIRAARTAER